MSGVEATGFVIGLISGVIAIIEATKTVYDAAKDAKGQPEAFRQVAARLPLVIAILKAAKEKTKTLDETQQEALEPILESCKAKAENLNKLFQKVIRKDDDKWYERYKKAISSLGKRDKVECLMEDILKDIQVLACERLVGIATDAQIKEIDEAIKQMNEMPSSLPDEAGNIFQTHSGSGDNIGHSGPGTMHVNKAAGDFYQSHNTGPVTFGNNENQQEAKTQFVNPRWMVPKTPSILFTGQKNVLAKLQRNLCSQKSSNDSTPRRFVITGIGGAGKSELCLKFANINRKKFRGVFWIDASSVLTIERGYIDGAGLCGITGDFNSAKLFFDNLKDPYLIVLDNADDICLDLNPYLPTGISSTTLITSRNDEMEGYATSGTQDLEKLDIEDAIELLLKASGTSQDEWSEKRADAEVVVKILTQHALAVVQAGAFIKRDLCTLQEYPAEFKSQRRQLMEFRHTQATSTYGDVYATFEVSATYLEKSKSNNRSYADALELLGILAHLYFVGVPEAIFTRAWRYAQTISTNNPFSDELETFSQWHVSKLPQALRKQSSSADMDVIALRQALIILRSFAFITIHPETKDISMHPLAHVWAKDRLDLVDRNEAWVGTAATVALSTKGNLDYQDFFRSIESHIESCHDISPASCFEDFPTLEVARIFYFFTWVLHNLKNTNRVKSLIRLLQVNLKSHIQANPKLSRDIEFLHAACLIDLGQNNTAQEILENIVKWDQETGPAAKTNSMRAQYMLAHVYIHNGRFQDAIDMLQPLVQIHKDILAPDNAELLLVQHVLGSALESVGRYEESIALLQEVVQIRATTSPPTHPDRLASQHELAISLQADGKNEEAISILREVVQKQATALPSIHPSLLASQQVLAFILHKIGQVEEALAIIKGVVNIARTTLDPSNKSRKDCEDLLARCIEDRYTSHNYSLST